MDKNLITQIQEFHDRVGLSEHRVGMLLAGNGRLFERLRKTGGKRFWPETIDLIRHNLAAELEKRGMTAQGAA